MKSRVLESIRETAGWLGSQGCKRQQEGEEKPEVGLRAIDAKWARTRVRSGLPRIVLLVIQA